MKYLLVKITLFLLRLRYRVKITGFNELKCDKGVLFLSNHPALIDPVLLFSILYPKYKVRAMVDEYQVRNYPLVRFVTKLFRLIPITNIDRYGIERVGEIKTILKETIDRLKAGENLLIYPSGNLKRDHLEHIKAASAVEQIVKEFPRVNIVLARQNGLWGSVFSWGFSGKEPKLVPGMLYGLKYLLLNFFFFMPRRQVEYEFVQAVDFPKKADCLAMNKYMEDFFNFNAWRNINVPYRFWRFETAREIPDPKFADLKTSIEIVPERIKQQIIEYLMEITGVSNVKPDYYLATDLGMDSIRVADLIVWLEQEFGFPAGNTESFQRVSDVMLAAIGKGVVTVTSQLKKVPKKWFICSNPEKKLVIPEANSIAAVFLKQALKSKDKVIIADENSGMKTYRDLITAILIFKPIIEALPGKYIGIMLPASVGASIAYLASIFAGKIPVMINWASGIKSVKEALSLIKVQNILTGKVFLARIKTLGFDSASLEEKFYFLEDISKEISFVSKFKCVLKSFLNWRDLCQSKINEIAVVLFTSGSETRPKAVPLTHKNILNNINDISTKVTVKEKDVLLGILPPFHSFGLTVSIVFPLCFGLRTVYYPNPMEAVVLGDIVKNYKCSFLLGTPTLLNNIVRVSGSDQLGSLRLAMTGAEKCSKSVYEFLKKRCPQLKVIEGYGVTECSPVISANSEDNPVYFTIGTVLPSFEYMLVDPETMKKVKTGQMGLLLVRGPSVFKGYINYYGKSPFACIEGKEWYDTGDLVVQDEKKILTFCARLKRFIKLGGEMISLPAIETALLPYLTDEKDEKPTLAIQATEDEEAPQIVLFTTKDVDVSTVNSFLRKEGLSNLYNIRQVIKIDDIPLLGNGKIDYRQLVPGTAP